MCKKNSLHLRLVFKLEENSKVFTEIRKKNKGERKESGQEDKAKAMELFQQQIDGYGEVVSANSTKTTPIREPLPIRVTALKSKTMLVSLKQIQSSTKSVFLSKDSRYMH